MDNAERVHSELVNQMAAARQAVHEQHQATASSSAPARRERKCLLLGKETTSARVFCADLADALRLHEEPIGEDQQAMLAEFERRRRVREANGIEFLSFL